MITIELSSGEKATVNDGVWSVPESEELQRILNTPAMQPPDNGHYAPSEDARKAEYVLKTVGGKWLKTDETFEAGKLY